MKLTIQAAQRSKQTPQQGKVTICYLAFSRMPSISFHYQSDCKIFEFLVVSLAFQPRSQSEIHLWDASRFKHTLSIKSAFILSFGFVPPSECSLPFIECWQFPHQACCLKPFTSVTPLTWYTCARLNFLKLCFISITFLIPKPSVGPPHTQNKIQINWQSRPIPI